LELFLELIHDARNDEHKTANVTLYKAKYAIQSNIITVAVLQFECFRFLNQFMACEVMMAVAVNVVVFGYVMPCGLADIHLRFRATYSPLIRWDNIYPKDKSNRCS
jgi:hypothetical protein